MEIGIAAETEEDIKFCCLFANKIVNPNNNLRCHLENRYPKNGRIYCNDIKSIVESLLQGDKHKIKFIVIFTDDDSIPNRRKEFDEEMIKNTFLVPVICVIPDKNIEDWLTVDIGAINKVLHTNLSSKPNNVDSKDWLSSLFQSVGIKKDFQRNIKKKEIIENTKLAQLYANNSFMDFKKKLSLTIQNIFRPTKIKKIKRGKIIKNARKQYHRIINMHTRRGRDRRV